MTAIATPRAPSRRWSRPRILERRSPRGSSGRAGRPASRRHAHRLTSALLADTGACRPCSTATSAASAASVPSALSAAIAWFTHVYERVALLRRPARSAPGPRTGRELARDDAVLHLGDQARSVGRVEVDHDAVDLAVVERLDGVGRVVEHRRLLVGLDRVDDEVVARRADLGAELVPPSGRRSTWPGDRRALDRHEGLVARRSSPSLKSTACRALRRERDLLHVEVVVLRAGRTTR